MKNTGCSKKNKNILIITSHFPPSNLTCVHRSRYLAKYLHKYGWNPLILTTDESEYKNDVCPELLEMLPSKLEILRSKAIARS